MTNHSEDSYRYSVVFSETARNLAFVDFDFGDPSQSFPTLNELRDAHEQLAMVFRKLGRWYQQVEAGQHYAADHPASTSGVLEAAFELQAAAQQTTELQKTLARASKAASRIRWCEDQT